MILEIGTLVRKEDDDSERGNGGKMNFLPMAGNRVPNGNTNVSRQRNDYFDLSPPSGEDRDNRLQIFLTNDVTENHTWNHR